MSKPPRIYSNLSLSLEYRSNRRAIRWRTCDTSSRCRFSIDQCSCSRTCGLHFFVRSIHVFGGVSESSHWFYGTKRELRFFEKIIRARENKCKWIAWNISDKWKLKFAHTKIGNEKLTSNFSTYFNHGWNPLTSGCKSTISNLELCFFHLHNQSFVCALPHSMKSENCYHFLYFVHFHQLWSNKPCKHTLDLTGNFLRLQRKVVEEIFVFLLHKIIIVLFFWVSHPESRMHGNSKSQPQIRTLWQLHSAQCYLYHFRSKRWFQIPQEENSFCTAVGLSIMLLCHDLC